MKNLSRIILFLMLLASRTGYAAETPRPWLDKGGDIPACAEALKIATAAFYSERRYIYSVALPQATEDVFVIAPTGDDLSGGDPLRVDETLFSEEYRQNDYAVTGTRWQKSAADGWRVVLVQQGGGSLGGYYGLYVIKDTATVDQFFTDQFSADHRKDRNKETYHPILEQSDRPPFILKNKQSNRLWAIDVGETPGILNAWDIYTFDTTGEKKSCTVHFHKETDHINGLMPAPVRQLAQLVDGTLGPGTNEGTLQPTGHLQADTRLEWANVLFRPWALKGDSYNTRERIDAELKAWSRTGPSYRRHYMRLMAAYPAAEKALASYYRTRFNKTPAEAKELAAFAVDDVFRSSFTFSREENAAGDQTINPWQK